MGGFDRFLDACVGVPTLTAHIVFGGGIAGLVAAHWLREADPDANIVVVERSEQVGGLLRSFDYGPCGRFDHGIHTITETGDTEIDHFLLSLLPRAEWEFLEGERRDLSGVYWRGRLHSNAHYLDLRALPRDEYERCMSDFFQALQRTQPAPPANMEEFTRQRFGRFVADGYAGPALRKMFGREASELDMLAGVIAPMDRIVLFDERAFSDLIKSDLLRARVAFPDQRRLPLQYSSGKKSFYPRSFGSFRIVESLAQRLARERIEIRTRTALAGLNFDAQRIRSVNLRGPFGEWTQELVGEVIWTAGIPALTQALELDASHIRMDAARRTAIVSILLDRPPATGDLFYFYCYDEGFQTYRWVNYSAYCPGAPRAGGFPISMELLLDPSVTWSPESAAARALEELRAMRILEPETRILFAGAKILPTGFPLPTVNNMRSITALKDAVRGRGIENLTVGGAMSEPNLFFQHDVLMDLRRKTQTLLRKEVMHG